jgi:hypothetical protein
LTISSFSCSSLFVEGLITTSLTICSFCCSNTAETTDGQTGGNKPINKKIGTAETTDGQIGGNKPFNKKIGTAETTDGQTRAYYLQFDYQ